MIKEETLHWNMSKSTWNRFNFKGMNNKNSYAFLQKNKFKVKKDLVNIIEHKINFEKVGEKKTIIVPYGFWGQLHTEDAWFKVNDETLIEYYIFYHENKILKRDNIELKSFFKSKKHSVYNIIFKGEENNISLL
jgi:hypothetical protein